MHLTYPSAGACVLLPFQDSLSQQVVMAVGLEAQYPIRLCVGRM